MSFMTTTFTITLTGTQLLVALALGFGFFTSMLSMVWSTYNLVASRRKRRAEAVNYIKLCEELLTGRANGTLTRPEIDRLLRAMDAVWGEKGKVRR